MIKRLIFLGTFMLSQINYSATPVTTDNGTLILPSEQAQQLLVIIPGANLAPKDYQQLASAIQEASASSVAIGIPKFAGDFPNPLQASGKIKNTIKLLRESHGNIDKKNIFWPSVWTNGVKETKAIGFNMTRRTYGVESQSYLGEGKRVGPRSQKTH